MASLLSQLGNNKNHRKSCSAAFGSNCKAHRQTSDSKRDLTILISLNKRERRMRRLQEVLRTRIPSSMVRGAEGLLKGTMEKPLLTRNDNASKRRITNRFAISIRKLQTYLAEAVVCLRVLQS